MAERAYRSKYTGQQLEDLLDYTSGLEGTIEGLKENDDFLNSSIEDLRENDEEIKDILYGKDNSKSANLVDLKLSSGNLWATQNIGATKPGDPGLYFQWGDTNGYNIEEGYKFGFDNYKYYSDGKFTKYNETDNLTILTTYGPSTTIDDAAKVLLDYYRIPTKEDIVELYEETTQTELRFKNNLVGIKFISKVDPSKSIIIPASGFVREDIIKDIDSLVAVWSSNVIPTDNYYSAYILSNNQTYMARICGLPIRPIVDHKNINKIPKNLIETNTNTISKIEEKITTIETQIEADLDIIEVTDKEFTDILMNWI